VLPKSTMGKALSYFLDEYDALIGYLRDGRFEIDNNLVHAATGMNQRMPHPEICRLAARRRDPGADFECVAHPMAA